LLNIISKLTDKQLFSVFTDKYKVASKVMLAVTAREKIFIFFHKLLYFKKKNKNFFLKKLFF